MVDSFALIDLENLEKLQLPQIRETLEDLSDCVGVFVPAFRTERVATLDRVAKHISTLVARKPLLQNAIKRYAAPFGLVGALFAYAATRMTQKSPPATQIRPVQAPATAPIATGDQGREPAQSVEQPPPQITPTQAREAAAFAQNVIDNLRESVAV